MSRVVLTEVQANSVYCVAINRGTWSGGEGRLFNIAGGISDGYSVSVAGGDLHKSTAYLSET